MSDSAIVSLIQGSLWIFMEISAPILAAAVVVGVLISILQAATSIQEQTLTFVPKLVAMIAILFFLGLWMLNSMTDYSIALFMSLASLSR